MNIYLHYLTEMEMKIYAGFLHVCIVQFLIKIAPAESQQRNLNAQFDLLRTTCRNDVDELKSKFMDLSTELDQQKQKSKELEMLFNETIFKNNEKVTNNDSCSINSFALHNLQKQLEKQAEEIKLLKEDRMTEKIRSSSLEATINSIAEISKMVKFHETLIKAHQDTLDTTNQKLIDVKKLLNETFKRETNRKTNTILDSLKYEFEVEKAMLRNLNKTILSSFDILEKTIEDTNVFSENVMSSVNVLQTNTAATQSVIQELQEDMDRVRSALTVIQIKTDANENIIRAMADCGPHKQVTNGDVTGDSFYGGSPNISCSQGYSQVGTAICNPNGTWESDVECRRECGPHKKITNGEVTGDSFHGGIPTLSCKPGYSQTGTAKCNANGEWETTLKCDRQVSWCQEPLGMQSRNIPDDAITASSSYDDSVGPEAGRIRTEMMGGAWCPVLLISQSSYEYLQINLGKLHMITSVEVQGRFGNGQGQEYAEAFFLEYQRENDEEWIRYRNEQGNEIFTGNENTYIPVLNKVSPPIVGQQIRFIPYSETPRVVCLRVEVYGCRWKQV